MFCLVFDICRSAVQCSWISWILLATNTAERGYTFKLPHNKYNRFANCFHTSCSKIYLDFFLLFCTWLIIISSRYGFAVFMFITTYVCLYPREWSVYIFPRRDLFVCAGVDSIYNSSTSIIIANLNSCFSSIFVLFSYQQQQQQQFLFWKLSHDGTHFHFTLCFFRCSLIQYMSTWVSF